MLNNWFARVTSGFNSWATRDASSVEADLSVLWAVIAAITSDLTLEYDIALSGESGVLNGAGTIGPSAEANLSLSYHVFNAVTADLSPFYQVIRNSEPLRGVLRIVGKQPSVTTTVFYKVEADLSVGWLISGSAEADLAALWEVGGGAAAFPVQGTLRLVGTQPTLSNTANKTVAPTAGVLRLVGEAPTIISPVMTYPAAGQLRLVGKQPIIQPQYVFPRAGRLRLVGNISAITSPQYTAPLTGVLRLIGRAPLWTDLVLEWPILSGTAAADLDIFWQVDGSVSRDLWLYWSVESRVGEITANQVVPTIHAAGTTQSTMTTRMTSNRITLRAA